MDEKKILDFVTKNKGAYLNQKKQRKEIEKLYGRYIPLVKACYQQIEASEQEIPYKYKHYVGEIPCMYLDANGFPCVGRGHLLGCGWSRGNNQGFWEQKSVKNALEILEKKLVKKSIERPEEVFGLFYIDELSFLEIFKIPCVRDGLLEAIDLPFEQGVMDKLEGKIDVAKRIPISGNISDKKSLITKAYVHLITTALMLCVRERIKGQKRRNPFRGKAFYNSKENSLILPQSCLKSITELDFLIEIASMERESRNFQLDITLFPEILAKKLLHLRPDSRDYSSLIERERWRAFSSDLSMSKSIYFQFIEKEFQNLLKGIQRISTIQGLENSLSKALNSTPMHGRNQTSLEASEDRFIRKILNEVKNNQTTYEREKKRRERIKKKYMNNWSTLVKEYHKFAAPFEKKISYMYLDSVGFPTIGCGHLLGYSWWKTTNNKSFWEQESVLNALGTLRNKLIKKSIDRPEEVIGLFYLDETSLFKLFKISCVRDGLLEIINMTLKKINSNEVVGESLICKTYTHLVVMTLMLCAREQIKGNTRRNPFLGKSFKDSKNNWIELTDFVMEDLTKLDILTKIVDLVINIDDFSLIPISAQLGILDLSFTGTNKLKDCRRLVNEKNWIELQKVSTYGRPDNAGYTSRNLAVADLFKKAEDSKKVEKVRP